MPTPPPEDPRVRFAAERTLLAWLRTGLALMGFGFVVAKFGLFLRELAVMVPAAPPPPANTVWSMRLGVALVLLGVVVIVLAAVEYRGVLGRIDRGEPYAPPRWTLGLVAAVLLAAVGVAMAGYLLDP